MLDVFAGSGALGLEALSRGASYVVFVDTAAASRAAIRQNIDSLSAGGQTRVLKRSALNMGAKPIQLAAFDVAFLDAPYRQTLNEPALTELHLGEWLADDARLVVEQAGGEKLDVPPEFDLTDERKYGDTLLRFLAYAPHKAN